MLDEQRTCVPLTYPSHAMESGPKSATENLGLNKQGWEVGREMALEPHKQTGKARARVMRDNHPGVRPGWLSREYRLVGALTQADCLLV